MFILMASINQPQMLAAVIYVSFLFLSKSIDLIGQESWVDPISFSSSAVWHQS